MTATPESQPVSTATPESKILTRLDRLPKSCPVSVPDSCPISAAIPHSRLVSSSPPFQSLATPESKILTHQYHHSRVSSRLRLDFNFICPLGEEIQMPDQLTS
ncbi:hypothetical protein QQF64_009113 [Cirrhinus molitorella]|uniref:Uncharacterized protein n=1 Tax=Cirrhinus molitorella TaxID=172907 RepID=A0ABR3M2S8_9TELE